jgi:hypothetical protein
MFHGLDMIPGVVYIYNEAPISSFENQSQSSDHECIESTLRLSGINNYNCIEIFCSIALPLSYSGKYSMLGLAIKSII